METLDDQVNLASFFARVAAAPERALLLDYDGTLAPFRAERHLAVPYPGVRQLLAALSDAGHSRLVIVSGRTIADLERLLGLDPLPELWGSHGWERRLPGGSTQPPELRAEAHEGLEAARAALVTLGLGDAVEPKPAGLALHWRGLDEATVQGLREAIGQLWSPIVLRSGLRVHPFDGGLELRVPGRDKGTVVRALLDELAPEAAIAYLGDDLTDEDAFEALGRRGLRVLVRPERRPSAADLWLQPPDELLAFLRSWARAHVAQPSTPLKEEPPHDGSSSA